MTSAEPVEFQLPEVQTPPERLGGAFWGVMISFLVHGLVVSTWVSRIAGMKSVLHLSDGTLGMALLATAIGSLAGIPMSGWSVTRYGSKRTATWTGVGFCLALVPLALASNLAWLVVALFFYGVMAGANDVGINAQAVGTEKMLGRSVISRFHGMFSFGGIVGASAGGFIARRGVALDAHLIAGSAVCLILAVAMSRLTIETLQTESVRARRVGLRHMPAALAILSAIGFCIFLSEGAIADWAAVYLKEVLGASEGFAPVAYAVFSAAMAVFRFSGDAISMRLGRAWTIRLGGATAAMGMFLVVLSPSSYWALAGFAAAGAGYSSIVPLVFAAGGRIPGISEGVGVATVSGLGYIGFLVGPPVIGVVSEFSSLRLGLALLVLLGFTAALLVTPVEKSTKL